MGSADEEDAGDDDVDSDRMCRSMDVRDFGRRRPLGVDDEDIDRRGEDGEDADEDARGTASSLIGKVCALSSRSRSPLRIAMELRNASRLAKLAEGETGADTEDVVGIMARLCLCGGESGGDVAMPLCDFEL